MALLPRPWHLHDVNDVERLLVRAVARSRFADDLSREEHADLVADLFRVAWQLADSFDPARGSFSTYLYSSAQRRAIDWFRRERGRTIWKFDGGNTHTRERPQFVSIDDTYPGLVRTLAEVDGDPAASGDPDLAGLLGAGDGSRSRDLATLGLRAPRRAA
jgi:DNA-directed RNA polymerase specialized sigma24 family protein